MIVNTDIEVGLELLCDSCGASLEETDCDVTGSDITVKVGTCDDCIVVSYNEGRDEAVAAISEQVDRELENFDFDKLFKESSQYDAVNEALKLMSEDEYQQAVSVLLGIQ